MCGRTRFSALSNERLGQLRQSGAVVRSSRSRNARRSQTQQVAPRQQSSVEQNPPSSSFRGNQSVTATNSEEEELHQPQEHSTIENTQSNSELFSSIENASPGFELPVVYYNKDEKKIEIDHMIWGLIPLYLPKSDKPDHYKLFNKRMESIEQGNYFFNLVAAKRCVVIVDGFYEWRTIAGKKQPYYVYLPETAMQMAAIYEDSSYFDVLSNETVTRRTFAILTGEPCGNFKEVHTRQPAFLSSKQVEIWLNPDTSATTLLQLLNQNPKDESFGPNQAIKFHPVSKSMTDAKYQKEDCSHPIKLGASISSFFSRSPNPKSDTQSQSNNTADESKLRNESAGKRNLFIDDSVDDDIISGSVLKKAKADVVEVLPSMSQATKVANEVIDLSLDDDDDDPKGNHQLSNTFFKNQLSNNKPPHEIRSFFQVASPGKSLKKIGSPMKLKSPKLAIVKNEGIAKFFNKI